MKLYPFRWINNPQRKLAGAAGGCILIRSDTLQRHWWNGLSERSVN